MQLPRFFFLFQLFPLVLIILLPTQPTGAAPIDSGAGELPYIDVFRANAFDALSNGIKRVIRAPWVSFWQYNEIRYLSHVDPMIVRLQQLQKELDNLPLYYDARSSVFPLDVFETLEEGEQLLNLHDTNIRALALAGKQSRTDNEKTHQLQQLVQSLKSLIKDRHGVRRAAQEALVYRDIISNSDGVTSAIATRAAMEHLYNNFLLNEPDLSFLSSSSYSSSSSSHFPGRPSIHHFPLVDRILPEYDSWLESQPKPENWMHEASIVVEFADFLRSIKASHKSLSKVELLNKLRAWLNHLTTKSRLRLDRLLDEKTRRAIEKELTTEAYAMRVRDDGDKVPTEEMTN